MNIVSFKKKVAIVGAGLYGCYIGKYLSNLNKYDITLFDKNTPDLDYASMINQFRIHRGYHYPRCEETLIEIQQSEKEFDYWFKKDYFNIPSYYVISRENSLTNSVEYESFMKKWGLGYTVVKNDILLKNFNLKQIETIYEVEEYILNKNSVFDFITNIKNEFNTKYKFVKYEDVKEKYDIIIVCAYANTNTFFDNFPEHKITNLKFELCYKPCIDTTNRFFKQSSVVVIDGNFCCSNPINLNKDIYLGSVSHGIVKTCKFKDNSKLSDYNSEFYCNKFECFKNLFNDYFNNYNMILKSNNLVWKVVFDNVEDTDERHTLVKKINDNTITVLSGKLNTCVFAKDKILEYLKYM